MGLNINVYTHADNGTFDIGPAPYGYTSINSAGMTITKDTTIKRSGAASMRISSTDTTGLSKGVYDNNSFNFKVNKRYKSLCYINVQVQATSGIGFFEAGGILFGMNGTPFISNTNVPLTNLTILPRAGDNDIRRYTPPLNVRNIWSALGSACYLANSNGLGSAQVFYDYDSGLSNPNFINVDDLQILELGTLDVVASSSRDVTKLGRTDGKITIELTGGTAPYYIQLKNITTGDVVSTGQIAGSSLTYTNLSEGSYELRVVDDYLPNEYSGARFDQAILGGYAHVLTYTISHPPEPVFTPTDETFLVDESFSISYSPELVSWSSFHSYIPNHMVSRGNRVFLGKYGTRKIWELNKGVKGIYFNSTTPEEFSVKFVVNTFPDVTKVWDNLCLHTSSKNGESEVYNDTFNKVQCYTNYQNTGEIEMVIGRRVIIPINESQFKTKTELVNQEFRLVIPRDLIANVNSSIFDPLNLVRDPSFNATPQVRRFRGQLKDKFVVVELTYNNTSGYELDFHLSKTTFRQSFR